MATFLGLCQDVARESGTFPNLNDPSSVINQTGRLERVVHWVRSAYADIENDRDHWRWLFGTFQGQLIQNVRVVDAGNMGIGDRFSRWTGEDDCIWTLLSATGQEAQETRLAFVPYEAFYRNYLTGDEQFGRPMGFTIMPDNSLAFYPTPDAEYQVKGWYYKNNQPLTADEDIFEMPDQFHRAILWRALVYLGVFDEATTQVSSWQALHKEQMAALRKNQLPRITIE